MYHKLNLTNTHKVVLKGRELKAIGKTLEQPMEIYMTTTVGYSIPQLHFRSIFNGCVLCSVSTKLTRKHCTLSLYQDTMYNAILKLRNSAWT